MASGHEFSRTFVVDPLPPAGLAFELAATAGERTALARRFDLMTLDELTASGTLRAGDLPGWIVLEGTLKAHVEQSCVVTTEPVPARVTSAFRRIFAPADDEPVEVELDPQAEEPEPLADSRLDVGEIVAEELSLALDPYPRAPGVELEDVLPEDEATGAFAALARLRRP